MTLVQFTAVSVFPHVTKENTSILLEDRLLHLKWREMLGNKTK